MTDTKDELTDVFWFVQRGYLDPSHLNPREWLSLIHDSLKSCKIVLRKIAEENQSSMTMQTILNHPIENSRDEKRVTPRDIATGIHPALLTNDQWLFIPLGILESKEEKGQFFERSLFIVADIADLMIMDVTFRKDPHPDQSIDVKIPKINENVSQCHTFLDCNHLGSTAEFSKIFMPYLKDPQKNWGKGIIELSLRSAIHQLDSAKKESAKIEEALQPFLNIRRRLGMS